ncbi:ankyrin repeat domain-containing protein [Sandarakinorhabdus sp.]|uniref:ankyrin repeat domain-containing protein n=1 Tax=Sandarakinorhabdus sp. TaxID=1916663 RepID=UPI00286DEE70|nr:ankyrin repeat domain-containing protein [Sandarakinorhabdus sp.]
MWRMAFAALLLAAGPAALILPATPAAAQFSESYTWLKAVKDKDVGKAIEMADKPGTTVVNTRDLDTGDAAIHIVTKRGDIGWVGLIVQKGGNINAKDGQGNTPLILASLARWQDGASLFIQLKAQINAQNRLGETALLKAVQGRDANMAKLLIESGANPDLADNSGVSARTAASNDPRAAAIVRMLKDVPVRAARNVQGPSL